MGLNGNSLSKAPSSNLHSKPLTQAYLHSLWRTPALRLLNYGIAITKKRQNSLLTSTLFDLLSRFEHSLTDIILSYLDALHCCNADRALLVARWKSSGKSEQDLRQGYGDDVARWRGVTVKGGRVVKIDCCVWLKEGEGSKLLE